MLARLIDEQMAAAIERHLEQMAELDEADRRNGSYSRHLLTALGDIELCVPRKRRFSAGAVLRAYAQREVEIDRMILACFVLGLSTPRRRDLHLNEEVALRLWARGKFRLR